MESKNSLFWDNNIIARPRIEYTLTEDEIECLQRVKKFILNFNVVLQDEGGFDIDSYLPFHEMVDSIIEGDEIEGIMLVPTIV